MSDVLHRMTLKEILKFMENSFFQLIPPDVIKFLLVLVFSLLIGLEQRRQHILEAVESRFGTDRTFTLIGILGFVLYVLNPQTLVPFLVGFVLIGILLGIYYVEKMRVKKEFGITSLVIALITYCLAPIIYTQTDWMVILLVVAVLVLTEVKQSLIALSKKFDSKEFTTLAKFLVIAGVILPLLPDQQISDTLRFSPYHFWLAIVAVSGISYFSYLLKKFVFPTSGVILTGILGGLYSSTATTVILARKSKESPGDNKIAVAIILATTMMYLRIFLLSLFFNQTLAIRLAPAFVALIVVSILLALYFFMWDKRKSSQEKPVDQLAPHANPLEFKTALLFGSLFIFFAVLTQYINQNFGSSGIKILSFLVGVTDIDPFIINLLQSKMNIADGFLVMAIVNATTSNNLLKMVYGISLGHKSIRRILIVGFGLLIITGLVISLVFL